MDTAALALVDQVTAGLPATVRITVPGPGTWLVPRIFIACHQFRGRELPGLAERYGFARA